ncbi:MAG: methionyl-tRNA formyltransferase [Chloroflexota bacterium]|nr:methionyl-tRNA formyltransferase [Chloroflexota bacterium]
MPQPARIVYFGTPTYAVPALRALTDAPGFEVVLVVTQPDRQGGRGHKLIAPAVKEAATELGLPVIQPPTLRDEDVREQLRAIRPDLFIVAAYGRIFSQAILDIPASGCLNLHASILPAYRGAAPIPAAILNGDTETGVTLMVMERGLDTGPIVDIRRTPIEPLDTTESLTARLADLGAELAVQSIPRYLDEDLKPVPQPTGATAVRQLMKADGLIDWSQPAATIERKVRAMWPWPRAHSQVGDLMVQIHKAEVRPGSGDAEPGSVHVHARVPEVTTGAGDSLVILRGQVAGSAAASGEDLVRGRVLKAGDRFSTPPIVVEPFIRPANAE